MGFEPEPTQLVTAPSFLPEGVVQEAAISLPSRTKPSSSQTSGLPREQVGVGEARLAKRSVKSRKELALLNGEGSSSLIRLEQNH